MEPEKNKSAKVEITYGKPKPPKKPKPLTHDDLLKYEIADELGLMEKVNQTGWKSLTAKESGKIGGLMAKRKKAIKKLEEEG